MNSRKASAAVVLRGVSLAAALACAPGCTGPMTAAGKAQEAAQDLNGDARFGRIDLALEKVAPAHRADFALHHAAWGGRVRILDYDLVGLSMKGKNHADVLVSVGWQHIDETEMRVTQFRQTWTTRSGSWVLDTEERTSGDVGLFGEADVQRVAGPQRSDAQFPSLTIR